MEYQKPTMGIIIFGAGDVVTLSGGTGTTGGDFGEDFNQP